MVTARCDGLDGTVDGLIQDASRCNVRPEDLICHAGQTTGCISAEQASVLHIYVSGVHDRHGHLMYPGMPISNLSEPGGMSSWTTGKTAPDLAHADAPWGTDADAPRSWAYARQALTYWLGMGAHQQIATLETDPRTGIVGDDLIATIERSFRGGETKDPSTLLPFIQQGRKLILYHGTSDPAISPYRSIAFYSALATKLHSMANAQASVRLFLVPGMHHCGGGPGPDRFDTLSAIEAWVEKGKAPDTILASSNSDGTTSRSLPLCPWPQQARYQGTGAMTDAANWRCAEPGRDAAPPG